MRNLHCFLTHFVVAWLEKRHMGEFARLHHVFSIHIQKTSHLHHLRDLGPGSWLTPRKCWYSKVFSPGLVNSSAKKCSRTDSWCFSSSWWLRNWQRATVQVAKCLRALGKKVDVVWMVVPKVCLQVDQLGLWTQFENPQNPNSIPVTAHPVPTLSPPCGSLAEIFLEAEAWQRRGPANSKRFQVDIGATCHGHLGDGLTKDIKDHMSLAATWDTWVCIHQYPSYFMQNSTPKTKIWCQKIESLFPQKAGNLMISVSPTEATMPRQWQVHLECPSRCAHTPRVWISVREPTRGGLRSEHI